MAKWINRGTGKIETFGGGGGKRGIRAMSPIKILQRQKMWGCTSSRYTIQRFTIQRCAIHA